MAKKNKKKLTPAEIEYQNRMESFQEHLPIADIKKRLLVTKDGLYYPMFKMGEKTLDLMSEEELNNFANRVMQVFASMNLDGSQFLTVPIPFDIAPYKVIQQKQITKLRRDIDNYQSKITQCERLIDEKHHAADNFDDEELRAKVIKDIENIRKHDIPSLQQKIQQSEQFIQYISEQVKYIVDILNSGLAAHKVCIVIPCIHGNNNETAVQEACINIENKLRGLAPDSHRCSEQEMRDVLYSILNPMRQDAYHVSDTNLPPYLS